MTTKIPKKKLTLSIDRVVYDQLGELPRKVSISEVVSLVLEFMIADVKGISEEEFLKSIENDPQRIEVRKYIQGKLGSLIQAMSHSAGNKEQLKSK